MQNKIPILRLVFTSLLVSIVFSCTSANKYPISANKVTLAWEDHSIDELGFKIGATVKSCV